MRGLTDPTRAATTRPPPFDHNASAQLRNMCDNQYALLQDVNLQKTRHYPGIAKWYVDRCTDVEPPSDVDQNLRDLTVLTPHLLVGSDVFCDAASNTLRNPNLAKLVEGGRTDISESLNDWYNTHCFAHTAPECPSHCG